MLLAARKRRTCHGLQDDSDQVVRPGRGMTAVAVIGAGFTGTLLSLHLLCHCPPTTRLVMIERNSQFGRGLAYSTRNPDHFLNVPAGRMSAYHDKPNDFVDWPEKLPQVEAGKASFTAASFVLKRVFGARIRALLNDEIERITAGRIRGYTLHDEHVCVLVRPKTRQETAPIKVARIVNCSGPGAGYDRIQDPLIRNLLNEASVRPDAGLRRLDRG